MELEPAYAKAAKAAQATNTDTPDTSALFNKGKRWSEEENTRLLEEIKTGISYEDIGKSHGRTATAIRSHLLEIAIKMIFEDNRDEEEVLALTDLSKDELDEAKKKKDSRLRKPKTTKKEPKAEPIPKTIPAKPENPATNVQNDIAQIKNEMHMLNLKLDKVIEYFNMVLSQCK